MKTLIAIVAFIIIIALAFFVYLYSGAYNVSAMEPHMDITLSFIDAMKDNSIENHAEGIEVPDLSDSSRILAGYRGFDAMCVQCHGAPGVGREEWAQGLYPLGPDLSDEVEEFSEAELFWIVKHGIKLTGMPAFGDSHSDEQIWDVVAFMQQLPNMGYYDYLEFGGSDGEQSEDGHEGHEH